MTLSEDAIAIVTADVGELTPDMQVAFFELLGSTFGDVFSIVHVNDIESSPVMPLMYFSANVVGAVQNGVRPPRGWTVHLNVWIRHDESDEIRLLSSYVDGKIWGWDNPFSGAGNIPGLLSVSSVGDVQFFTPVSEIELPEQRNWYENGAVYSCIVALE